MSKYKKTYSLELPKVKLFEASSVFRERLLVVKKEQFEELLSLKHEVLGIECKGPGPRSDAYHFAKIARAVMGMTNRRDGGIVIIGIQERNGILNPIGLSPNDANSWRDNDKVIDAFTTCMSPPASFELSMYEFEGKEFAILEVHEFAEIPTICKIKHQRDHRFGNDIVLRDGACYIRSRHKPETVEISTVERMRELLDLATEKGVRKFVTQAQKAGMHLSEMSQISNQELFEQQVKNLTSPLIEKILSRGYWKTIIRPHTFAQEVISYDALSPLIESKAVRIFGGGFPNVQQEIPRSRGVDCIGQEIEAGYFLEVWYLYQSGQFFHMSGFLEDWLDQEGMIAKAKDWQPENKLSIEEVIRQFTGIFIFASNLALTNIYTESSDIYIDVLIKGLQGRYLYIETPVKVPLRWNYVSQILEFRYTKALNKDNLIANTKALALSAARELFLRFGWDSAQASLESIQSKLNIG